MDRMNDDRSRSKNVTNPYTNTKMPLENDDETRDREDVEDLEEE
jgi:hypothetical protein